MKPSADLLSTLNPQQKQAVSHTDGPMLIVAGAGTGKTTVLINRLAYLILEKGVRPERILLTTFTEKGAHELDERADKILPYGIGYNRWIYTFHGFCERILRDHALDIGLTPGFKLLNQTDQWILIKKNLSLFNLDYYKPLGDPTKFVHELITHFSRLKDENISPARYLDYVEGLKADSDAILSSKDKPAKKKAKKSGAPADAEALDVSRLAELAEAYHLYNKLLLDNAQLDFGDLIAYTIKLFVERPNILEHYRGQFEYIMVDEFQDTNTAQYELIKLLAAPKNNLVAVGDDDQSIYRFRGASLSNIMQFKDDFSNASEVVLTNNYRSGQAILDTAYGFITHNNPNRLEAKLGLDKKLKSHSKEKGETVYLEFPTDFKETQSVAEMIEALHASKQAEGWADIAVLVRANDTADKFTRELTRRNIPNHFVSLKGLYYKPIVLDSIAYLKLLDSYHEPSALYRVLDMKPFALSHSDLLILTTWARRKLWSLFETLEKIDAIKDVSAEGKASVHKLLKCVRDHAVLARDHKASKVYVHFVRECLEPMLDHDADRETFSYLNQFYSKIKSFEAADSGATLKDFLELINLEMEAGETGGLAFNYDDADTVKVMTVHAAKGLEFGHVFIPNLVDRKFPTIHRKEKIPVPEALGGPVPLDGDIHLEEERRLFYVAMTRAKRSLCCTGAKDYGGATKKKPSRFVDEANLPVTPADGGAATELERDLAALDKPLPRPAFALPLTYSFSQLTTFERCPLDYKFIYILKLPTEDSPQAVFGRVIHNCLRQYFLPLLDDGFQPSLFGGKKPQEGLFTLKKLLELYGHYWHDAGYADRKEADDFKNEGKKMLTAFHNASGNERPSIMFLEKKFNLPLGQYVLSGTMDRADLLSDGTVELIDYKTGKPKDKLGFSDKRQLLLYQAAMEEVFGKKVSCLSFYYLKDGSKQSFVAKPGEVEKVKQQMLDLIEEIKTSDFKPRKGGDCAYCQHGPVADED